MAKTDKFDPKEITGVALINKQHGVLALPKPARHHHLFALAAFLGHDMGNAQQGFVGLRGRFLDRDAAALIVGKTSGKLYSEDIW